ncbi:hypothetical protein [Geoglobus ahangari]
MSSILEEHFQLITVYSAFIISGSFIFRHLDNPWLKICGSALFFIGLIGIFLMVANIYMTKLERITKRKSFTDFLNSTLLISIFFSVIIIFTLFVRNLLFVKIESKNDYYFILGGVFAVGVYIFSWIILLYFPLILRAVSAIAIFSKKQNDDTSEEENSRDSDNIEKEQKTRGTDTTNKDPREEINQLTLIISYLALGVSFFTFAVSQIPQLKSLFSLKYAYVLGVSLMIVFLTWLIVIPMQNIQRAPIKDLLASIWRNHKLSLIIVSAMILLSVYQVFYLEPADIVSQNPILIFIPKNESKNITRTTIIKQYDDQVTYSIRMIYKNLTRADLTIKFESPFIFENGKTISFSYNASDPSKNETRRTHAVTLNKAGGMDYIYVRVNITGHAIANGSGKILISIVPDL